MRSLVQVFKAGFTHPLLTDFRPQASTTVGWVREPFAGAWQRNMEMESTEGLITSSPIYACMTRIANDIAKLCPEVLERQESGIWTAASEASPFWYTLRKPNHYQNRIQFLVSWLLAKLMHGNTYILKEFDNRGIVSSMYVLDSRRVIPKVTSEGDVYYTIGGEPLARRSTGITVPARWIIHDRGPTFWHQLCGVPPLLACAFSGSLGLQIQRNSFRFFGNLSRPGGFLKAPGKIDDDQAARLKKEFEKNYGGSNLGRLAVLENNMSFEPVNVPAQESQLAEQLGLTVVDVARAFNMPLYKIGAGPIPTNNNVEALNQQYYEDCLQSYIEAIELCWDEGIGTGVNQKVELNLGGLLRMDSAAKTDKLVKEVGAGITSPNEARFELNRPPVDGGASPLAQQQNFSLEALAKRDARDDPFAKTDPPAPTPAPAAPAPDMPPAQSESAKELAAFVERSTTAVQAQVEALAGIDKSVQASTAAVAAAAEQSRAEALANKQAAELAIAQMAESMRAALEAERAKAAEAAAAERAAIMADVEQRLAAVVQVKHLEQEEPASSEFAAALIAKFAEAEVVCG